MKSDSYIWYQGQSRFSMKINCSPYRCYIPGTYMSMPRYPCILVLLILTSNLPCSGDEVPATNPMGNWLQQITAWACLSQEKAVRDKASWAGSLGCFTDLRRAVFVLLLHWTAPAYPCACLLSVSWGPLLRCPHGGSAPTTVTQQVLPHSRVPLSTLFPGLQILFAGSGSF